jgi:hypothetical protein
LLGWVINYYDYVTWIFFLMCLARRPGLCRMLWPSHRGVEEYSAHECPSQQRGGRGGGGLAVRCRGLWRSFQAVPGFSGSLQPYLRRLDACPGHVLQTQRGRWVVVHKCLNTSFFVVVILAHTSHSQFAHTKSLSWFWLTVSCSRWVTFMLNQCGSDFFFYPLG